MFRLLGILAIGNLLFGGHHRRRALRRGLLLGALLGFLPNRDFDMDRARSEARRAAEKAGRTAREARKAERADVIRALPVSGTKEAKEIEELVDGLERNSAAASMMGNVPTIDFPEEDGKYYASRKYGYAE